MKLDFVFPDKEGLLETSYADFRSFMKCYGIEESDTGYTLSLKVEDHGCF